MTEFQKFLQQEMDKRDLSQNAFAALVGVSSGMMSNHMKQDGTAPPLSLGFLKQVAQATNTSLITLLKLAYPDLPRNLLVDLEPDVRLIAERIAKLPPEQREIIDRFILSLTQ